MLALYLLALHVNIRILYQLFIGNKLCCVYGTQRLCLLYIILACYPAPELSHSGSTGSCIREDNAATTSVIDGRADAPILRHMAAMVSTWLRSVCG